MEVLTTAEADGCQIPQGEYSPLTFQGGGPVEGVTGQVTAVSVGASAVAWQTASGTAGVLLGDSFARFTDGNSDAAVLFASSAPAGFLGNQGGQTNTMYFFNVPAGILTTQGLA